jgi:hypothetical protein
MATAILAENSAAPEVAHQLAKFFRQWHGLAHIGQE